MFTTSVNKLEKAQSRTSFSIYVPYMVYMTKLGCINAYLRSNQDLFTHPIPHILTNKRTCGVFSKPQTLLSIGSHKLGKGSSNARVGVGRNERTLVRSLCIGEFAVQQKEFSAIVDAVPGIFAGGTIVQFSIILRFALCHGREWLARRYSPLERQWNYGGRVHFWSS